MRLKEVSLHGFKSFARKTTIKFDKNYSVIVGPNGCGKSNILDAIRWVLGEQSPKSLRGSKMEDVVFAGTKDVKPMNYCKVSISFDNKDRSLAYDYDEIRVSRTVYRSGESKYEINNKSVRLKDIRSLLLGTGLGKEGYSIISQGKIDEIISSKAEDRRELIDEAAGVSQYKYKRDESIKKLSNTIDNLERLEDIMSEVTRNYNYLKKESRKAKEAIDLKEDLIEMEISSYKFLKQEAENRFEDDKVNLKKLAQEKYIIKKEIALLEKNIKEADLLSNNIEKSLLDNKKVSQKKNDEFNKLKTEVYLAKEKRENLIKDIDRLEIDINGQKEKVVELKEKSSKEDQTLDELKTSLNTVSNDISIAETDLDNQNKALENLSQDYKELISQIETCQNQLFDISISKRSSQSIVDTYKKDIDRAKALLEDNEIRLATLKDEKLSLSAEIDKLNEDKVGKLTSIEVLKEDLNKISESGTNLRNQEEELRLKLNELESNYKVLKNIHNSYEGFYRPVQNFLKITENNKEIRNRYINPLAEEIRVRKGFEKAIEYALGSQLQNIITRTSQDAQFLIEYLKRERIARLTFLPIDRYKSYRKDLGNLTEEDYLAFASDVVEYDPIIEPIISSLLSRTIITKDLKSAMIASNKSNNRVISLDGDIINKSGSMVGGSNKSKQANLLNRKDQLDKLQVSIQEEKSQLVLINNELQITRTRYQNQENSLNILVDELSTKNKLLDENNNKLAEINNSISLLESKIKDLQADIDQKNILIESHTVSESTDDSDLELKLKKLNREKNDLDQSIEQAKDIKNSKERKLLELRTHEDSLKRDSRIYENSIEETRLDILNEENSIDRKILYLNDSKNELEELKSLLEDNSKLLPKMQEGLNKLLKEIELKEDRLRELRDAERLANKKLLDNTRILNDLISSISEKKSTMQAYSSEASDRRNFILDEYALYENDLSILMDKFEAEEFDNKEIRLLRNKFIKISNYNPNSIEEFAIIDQEYKFYIQQKDDLLEAKKDVEEVIKRLEKQILEEFNKSFDQINERFNHVFERLFEGGSARLVIDDRNDLASGIDIEAKLPGKAMQNLSLLSGGERSLIAVALLFSLFEINPAPFCILDEADAALDESNINRYLEYLKSFDDIQFIIITHRKTSMEIADKIYGVTMEEEGISKLVNLELDKLMKI